MKLTQNQQLIAAVIVCGMALLNAGCGVNTEPAKSQSQTPAAV